MDRGPSDGTVFRAGLERVLYLALREALQHSMSIACKRCNAKAGEWCAGVPWPHPARLRYGVREAIYNNVRVTE